LPNLLTWIAKAGVNDRVFGSTLIEDQNKNKSGLNPGLSDSPILKSPVDYFLLNSFISLALRVK
jgi:hypothetical protein